MTEKKNLKARTIVYSGDKALTVSQESGISVVVVWGDQFTAYASSFAHFDVIDDPAAQLERFGAVLLHDAESANAKEILALAAAKRAEQADADRLTELQQAHSADRRAELRLRHRQAAVDDARAEHAATTAGKSK